MSISDYKLQIFKEIMNIEDTPTVKEIYNMIHQFLVEHQKVQEKSRKESFEEWNKQFNDDKGLDEYIPEYDCTLREYRKAIFEAEMDDNEITMDEFKENMKSWL